MVLSEDVESRPNSGAGRWAWLMRRCDEGKEQRLIDPITQIVGPETSGMEAPQPEVAKMSGSCCMEKIRRVHAGLTILETARLRGLQERLAAITAP